MPLAMSSPRAMTLHLIDPTRTDPPEDLFDLLEEGYTDLLKDLRKARADAMSTPEGAGDLPSVAERTKALSSVADFLAMKQKLRPEKPTSGIDRLRGTPLTERRPRRNRSSSEPETA